MDIQGVDAFMNIFGFKRVENSIINENQTPKYKVGDYVYFEHCWQEIIGIYWKKDHYEYSLKPEVRLIKESEL